MRGRRGEGRGSVYVEVCVCFPCLFVLFHFFCYVFALCVCVSVCVCVCAFTCLTYVPATGKLLSLPHLTAYLPSLPLTHSLTHPLFPLTHLLFPSLTSITYISLFRAFSLPFSPSILSPSLHLY